MNKPEKKRGRKLKHGEATKIVTIRIPISKVDQVKKAVKFIIENNLPEVYFKL
jgi:hypothetical protein